ncbi:MAG: type II/IV secretion system protein [Lentisphaerae bacterium]|nr:type II/IV secretion system protein [Lentisphaerota bacterium]
MNELKLPDPVDLEKVRIDPAWLLRLPATLAMRRLILPLCVLEERLVVAMADPSDVAAIEAVKRSCGHEVVAIRADQGQLRRHLLRILGDSRSAMPTSGGDDAVALADDILRAAMLRQASDIHFDPGRDGLLVRLRVDGVLEDFMRLPTSIQPALSSRIKVMAGLDIAERRAPQDGGFVWRMGGAAEAAPCDVRVATLPIRFGEKITMRLLESGRDRLTLDALGLSEEGLASFARILDRPHGLVLLTGPTGSGKTTTLYAAIRRLLSQAELNILTVEDPVEYEIGGVSQVEVDSGDKVNFAKALRSLLRHDPDVIMIGEIRDRESLDTAVKASLTGHLVLSTLHTNDAVSAVTRLADMGLAAHMIAATLRLSAAQRLVRRLCPHCREGYAISAAEAGALDRPALEGETAWRSQGCLCCAGRSLSGRTGIFELMVPDTEVASLIAASAPIGDIIACLRSQGVPSLADDAIRKVLAGETSIDEILKITVDI